MSDDQMAVAPSEATTDDLQPEATTEAQEAQTVEGQDQEVPAPDAPDAAADGEKTETQKRRERRKAAKARRDAELAEARKREADARAKREQLEETSQSVKKPNRDDFEDPDDYIAANAAFLSTQSLNDREAKAVEAEISQHQEAQRAALAQNWAEQVEDAKERFEDFEKIAFSAPISDDLVPLIASSPDGADLAYYLGSNHHEAARISQLNAVNPTAAAMEIGRLSALASAPQPKTQTSAPKPPETVGGAGSTPMKDPSKMTHAEHRAWREAGGGT